MKANQRQWFVEELIRITVMVYRQRNAQHMPAKYRAQIKAEARPHLREAIHWARHTRNALNAGDFATTQRLYERAVTSFVLGLAMLNAPYAQQGRRHAVAIASLSRKGGKEKAAQREDENEEALEELDRLIKGCIANNKPYRVKEWLEEFPLKRTAMYERIKRIKEGR